MSKRGRKRNRRAGRKSFAILVAKVLRSERRIRYCAVIDEKATEIAGGMRPGVKSLESESESSRIRVQSVIGRAMAETWDKFHGRADYVIVHRAKVTFFIFPLSGSRSVLISAEPDYPLQRLRAFAEIIAAFR